jgi:hypothetical protein
VSTELYASNHPSRFWKLMLKPEPTPEEWAAAAVAAAHLLPESALHRGTAIPDLLQMTLGEGQFGADHWRLSRARRFYYRVKPALPRWLITRLRRVHRHAIDGAGDFELGWPVEDRYPRFLWETVGRLMEARNEDEAPFLCFWPEGRSSAFVLTHDVETARGQAQVPAVADLEERLGFRSSFNFVLERYPLDRQLIRDLLRRGFEVGVHGLKHDGRLYSSRKEFERQAQRINRHVSAFGAVGFRSPLTHRHPDWMQSLDVEYDLSFFDTDPYEPIPGGTMSVWPFQLGRFVELPYTLAQDFTLTHVLRESSPRLWLEKMAFLDHFFGMGLVNTHPDYLDGGRLELYLDFLEQIRCRGDRWHALPREVARWWRLRGSAENAAELAGAVEGVIRRDEDGEVFVVTAAGDGIEGERKRWARPPRLVSAANDYLPETGGDYGSCMSRLPAYRDLEDCDG